jgi:hypothetical protein
MIKKIIYPLILILMTSCFGETDCSKYPQSKLNWLPYRLSNVIKFSDMTDTIEFTIEETLLSDAYSFKNNCKCACEANALFKTDINKTIDIKIEGYSNFYDTRTNYEYNLIKYGGDFYSAQRSDDFYFSDENNGIENEIISEYTVGDKKYKNVLKLELDTIDSKPEIWRLIIADSVGIIQFDDCKLNKTWKRVE